MGKFVKGDVVVVPFPFSDLTQTKRRPALVVVPLRSDDVILCQITSNTVDPLAIPLVVSDFNQGAIGHDSYIRPNRLFTADSNLILRCAGRISNPKINEVIDKIVEIIRS